MKKLPKISLFESSDIENLNLAKSQSRIESGYIDGYCFLQTQIGLCWRELIQQTDVLCLVIMML